MERSRQFKRGAMVALFAAVTAAPVAAGTTDWSFTGVCGGTSFSTCLSGSVSLSGNTITVNVTNVGPGVMTSVGVWNLGSYSGVTGTTNAAGWAGPTSSGNGIQGVVDPSQNRKWFATTNGINDGIDPGGSAEFSFTFTGTDLSWLSEVGIGAHMQGGPGGCSSKIFLQSDGDGGGEAANEFVGPDECTPTTVVPEPGTLFLLGSGVLGLAVVSRRRREDEIA